MKILERANAQKIADGVFFLPLSNSVDSPDIISQLKIDIATQVRHWIHIQKCSKGEFDGEAYLKANEPITQIGVAKLIKQLRRRQDLLIETTELDEMIYEDLVFDSTMEFRNGWQRVAFTKEVIRLANEKAADIGGLVLPPPPLIWHRREIIAGFEGAFYAKFVTDIFGHKHMVIRLRGKEGTLVTASNGLRTYQFGQEKRHVVIDNAIRARITNRVSFLHYQNHFFNRRSHFWHRPEKLNATSNFYAHHDTNFLSAWTDLSNLLGYMHNLDIII